MSKRENVIIMFNKLKTAKTTRNLQEEFEEVYKDLKTTRAEVGQAIDKRTEEMQEKMANILAKAICFMTVGKNEKAFKYLIEQYEIIKKDLSDNDQEDRQINIKIF
jgi:predicted nucleotide-binding protein (sugar kinase/HSP70/actin superfamily)